jgi:hypothetical protein
MMVSFLLGIYAADPEEYRRKDRCWLGCPQCGHDVVELVMTLLEVPESHDNTAHDRSVQSPGSSLAIASVASKAF